MNEKKNIDRLFQEKFKDFEFTPPDGMWDNIRTELHPEKKERRVLPLWLRFTGVAAVLLIGFGLYTTFTGSFESGNNPVVIEGGKVYTKDSQKPAFSLDPVRSNETVSDTDPNLSRGNTGTAVASGGDASANRESQPGSNYTPNAGAGQSVASRNSSGRQGGHVSAAKHRRRHYISGTPQEAVADNPAANDGSNRKRRNANGARGVEDIASPAESAVAGRNDNNKSTASDNGSPGRAEINTIDRSIPIVPKAGNEALADTPVDTTAAAKPENELEKLLQEKLNGEDKDKQQVAEAPFDKWALKPQVAPLYYNSLSNGSPIDAQFASNSKSYDGNMSYGLGVNYAVSNRLRIRSGVNTVNLSYSTNGIEFYASLMNSTPNVSTSKNANIVVQNGNPHPDVNALAPDQLPQQKFNGSMIQKMGYVEVPLEVSYALLNKKFGIEVIGGFSTLFLNDNNVYVTSTQGYNTEVGEAENLNNIHFSTNVGIGFRYRFLKSFQASFEPTFKYQVNTFSGDAGNFKPYFIGLYSGISFSF